MKKQLLSVVAMLMVTSMTFAQRYENIKNMVMLQQYDKAMEELNKQWDNPKAKFTTKPEAFILKATLLATMGNAAEDVAKGGAMVDEAVILYNEYLEKDPKKSLLTDPVYTNTPITLYTNLFNRGIKLYNDKSYENAFNMFEKVLVWSKFLNDNGIAQIPLDTNAILLTGAAAQASEKHDAEAFKYFALLADNKVSGKDNEFLYRYLSRKCFDRNDAGCFTKYMTLGRELYPDEEFYTYQEEDFIFSLEDQEEKMKRVVDFLAKNPNNLKVQSAYAEILFEKLNPRNADEPLPAGAEEMEKNMVTTYTKIMELDPASPIAYMNLASHHYNKSIRFNNDLVAHQRMMRDKARANTPEPVKGKPAPKAPAPEPADVERRKELQSLINVELLEALKYYEGAIAVYEKMAKPESIDKRNWQNAISNLIDINKELRNSAIGDKNVADEKKYSAGYDKYKAMYDNFKM